MKANETKKENLLNSGLSGRLHRWAKNEHAVGLDVNDGQIVASHFTGHNGGLLLDALAMETVDPGSCPRADPGDLDE